MCLSRGLRSKEIGWSSGLLEAFYAFFAIFRVDLSENRWPPSLFELFFAKNMQSWQGDLGSGQLRG